MSLRAESFRKQKDVLREIAKASDAIRRKRRLIKLGKATVEQALSDTLINPNVAELSRLP